MAHRAIPINETESPDDANAFGGMDTHEVHDVAVTVHVYP